MFSVPSEGGVPAPVVGGVPVGGVPAVVGGVPLVGGVPVAGGVLTGGGADVGGGAVVGGGADVGGGTVVVGGGGWLVTDVLTEMLPPLALIGVALPVGEAPSAFVVPIATELAPDETETFTEATGPLGITLAFRPARRHVIEPPLPAH